jgi:hypothetical protein
MLHNCHEAFLQPHAINYHNLISYLCKKLRISDGNRDDRRGSGAQLAEGAGDTQFLNRMVKIRP